VPVQVRLSAFVWEIKLTEYFAILIFMLLAMGLAVVPLLLNCFLAPNKPDLNKNSAYECGFDPFDDARAPFDIRFYLVAILFIMFDLETAFLFPWGVSFKSIGAVGFWAMVFFLLVLVAGFIFEWRQGALEWE
jgi:NADH-quinone oxidoreductase subunit A